MITGLVGHTGFVGGNLVRQRSYDRTFHRPDIADIAGCHFDRLVISGVPAQKWLANTEPEADAANIAGLVRHLSATTARRAVLISTVDVYPHPTGVDEATEVSPGDHEQAYGRNRLLFEWFVTGHFPDTLVVRLPALFGPGLKKNLVYDLCQGRPEEFCHRDSTFQFYDVRRLSDDIDTALDAGLRLVNLATEPLSAATVATEVFGRTLSRTDGIPAAYDMRTRHARAFGGAGPYVRRGADVLADLHTFAAGEVPA
jgi:nucleoside-diphosphate-sugar epimerase